MLEQQQSGILTQIETDENDNLVLPFPSEILEAVGWQAGDVLSIDIFAGRVVFRKEPGSPENGAGTYEG